MLHANAGMRRTGLEWVHRLVQEPSRLARRYLVHGIPFAIRLLGVSLWRGFRAPRLPGGHDDVRHDEASDETGAGPRGNKSRASPHQSGLQ